MRTVSTDLVADTLFGKTRRQVLGLLFGRSDETFYVREVARRTGAALGAVQKELTALADAGILDRTVRGRQVYFSVNRASPVFQELRALVAKTSGIVDVIRTGLEPLHSRITVAFVFGSIPRGTERSASDVDLFVVGTADFGEVVDALSEAQQVLGRDINPVVQSRTEFARRIEARDHFVRAVLDTPRQFVIGTGDELENLAGERLAASTRDQRRGGHESARHSRARSARQRGTRSKS